MTGASVGRCFRPAPVSTDTCLVKRLASSSVLNSPLTRFPGEAVFLDDRGARRRDNIDGDSPSRASRLYYYALMPTIVSILRTKGLCVPTETNSAINLSTVRGRTAVVMLIFTGLHSHHTSRVFFVEQHSSAAFFLLRWMTRTVSVDRTTARRLVLVLSSCSPASLNCPHTLPLMLPSDNAICSCFCAPLHRRTAVTSSERIAA